LLERLESSRGRRIGTCDVRHVDSSSPTIFS